MYADDIALITETREQMQQALNIIDDAFIKWGLQISRLILQDVLQNLRFWKLDQVEWLQSNLAVWEVRI